MTQIKFLFFILTASALLACDSTFPDKQETKTLKQAMHTFDADLTFLQKFTELDILKSGTDGGRVAISADLQGRVMTSSSEGGEGQSYGWINRSFFEERKKVNHMNPYGGEERFWLGPEGGQYSIFFKAGDEFTFDNWQTPAVIDSEPFERTFKSDTKVTYEKQTSLTNYSGFNFDLHIERSVEILPPKEMAKSLATNIDGVNIVGYRTINKITNTGKNDWDEQKGLLSIWLLGMFNPAEKTTIVIPFITGDNGDLGPIVKDDYFGKVPADRLRVLDGVIFFKGDGKYRGKIGLSSDRAKNILGSYDEDNHVLTIVKYKKPTQEDRYVNSSWEIQEHPYQGDVVNSYNDGPPSPGVKPMGPFYELETSSPALALAVGTSGSHVQETYHFEGDPGKLDPICYHLLGVHLREINAAF